MRAVPTILYALSGFCILSLETVWIREVGLRTGNTVVSASWVVAVFFLFAAAGNWAGGVVSAGAGSAHPLRGYGIAELLTAAAAIVLFVGRGALHGLLTEGPRLDFLYAVVLAGPIAFFSGAGLPFLASSVVTNETTRTSRGGVLYAANLAGAACGVVAGGIVLPSSFGYSGAVAIVSAVLLLVGGTAFMLSPMVSKDLEQAPSPEKATDRAHGRGRDALGVSILIASGALSLALELVALKYFMLLAPGSVYAVSAVLCAFIVDLGIGAVLASATRRFGVRTWTALTVSLTAGAVLLAFYPTLFHFLIDGATLRAPMTPGQRLVRTVGVALLVFLPGLACIGAVFPLAWEAVKAARLQGRAFGRIFAVNKAGSATGVFLVPYVLLPLLGLPGSMLAVATAYGVIGILASTIVFTRARFRLAVAAIIAIALAAAVALKQPPVHLQDGDTLLALYTGKGPVTTVVEDSRASRHVMLDSHYMLNGTAEALSTQRHEGWIPLVLHPRPSSVTFIGIASGISADATLDFPIEKVTAVEIVPEVVTAAKEHFGAWNQRLFTDPRSRIVVDDGRHVVATGERQDVIICDLFNPVREGVSSMYSTDFFELTRSRLRPGGICCVWLAAYQMDEEIAGVIIRSFLDVYPNVLLVRADFSPIQPAVGLVGSAEPVDLSESFIQRRLLSTEVTALRGRSPFLGTVANFRTLLVGDLRWIADDFQSYPLNTDERPFIEFNGSRMIAHGRHLRALTLLDWMGTRFASARFTSCTLGESDPSELIAGIRAGNYLYAAAVMLTPLPHAGPEKLLHRRMAAQQHMNTARTLLPGLGVREEDLR